MGRAHEKWHICKCLIFHAKNLLKVYTQKNSGYTKSRRKIRQQKIPKINSKFLHIEVLSREAWASKDTRFLTLSRAWFWVSPQILTLHHHAPSAHNRHRVIRAGCAVLLAPAVEGEGCERGLGAVEQQGIAGGRLVFQLRTLSDFI